MTCGRQALRQQLQPFLHLLWKLPGRLLKNARHRNGLILMKHPKFVTADFQPVRFHPPAGNGIRQVEWPRSGELHSGGPGTEVDQIENFPVLTHENRIIYPGSRSERLFRNLRKSTIETAELLIGSGFRIAPPAVVDHQRIALRSQPGDVFQYEFLIRQRSREGNEIARFRSA